MACKSCSPTSSIISRHRSMVKSGARVVFVFNPLIAMSSTRKMYPVRARPFSGHVTQNYTYFVMVISCLVKHPCSTNAIEVSEHSILVQLHFTIALMCFHCNLNPCAWEKSLSTIVRRRINSSEERNKESLNHPLRFLSFLSRPRAVHSKRALFPPNRLHRLFIQCKWKA